MLKMPISAGKVVLITLTITKPRDKLHIPLELIPSNRDSIRETREVYLIERGQTLELLALNKKEET